MANYDASIRINTNISPDKMDRYEINTESIERLNKSIEKMRQILVDSFDIQTTKMSMEILNHDIQDSLKKLSSIFMQYNYDDLLKGIHFTVSEMVEKIGMEQIGLFQNIDFGRLFRDSLYHEKYDEASNMAFEYTESEVESEEDISQEELLEIFNEQMEDKIGWQEKLYNKSEEFKRKYYVFYKIFIGFLIFILGQIAIYFAQLGIAYAFGNITSDPKEDSPVIYYFEQRTEVNIIGETDSYYFITYTDSEGNEVMGYSNKEDMEIVPQGDIETMEEAK
ncbi:hypothetical protein IMSAGC012_02204 [Lachnospiraceae bacterium]|nr:hypothetical protein IMSAGC012_02204 [Lachnospiraceae bacterium]GFI32997.1 hypothetical protein IMSAGC013_04404 [Lachnospiraceae bacterium]